MNIQKVIVLLKIFLNKIFCKIALSFMGYLFFFILELVIIN
jgi:hypothetical protein